MDTISAVKEFQFPVILQTIHAKPVLTEVSVPFSVFLTGKQSGLHLCDDPRKDTTVA